MAPAARTVIVMSKGNLEFHSVTFLYDTASEAVFQDLSAAFGPGWTGIIGANGSGKTTLLRLASGQLQPTAGRVIAPGEVIGCPQRTDDPPEHLVAFLAATDGPGCALRGQLGIQADWAGRWETLSHGERKRAQIAVALWRQPSTLAIDEPTNHIDRAARQLLAAALQAYRGVGLLVSHDRELLDMLCTRCLFLEPHAVVMRPGGYTKAVALAREDAEQARTRYRQTKRELKQLEREEANRRHEAAQQDQKRSKRKLAKGDSDGREKIDRARVSGKDGVAGRKQRQMQGRLQQAHESLAGLYVPRKQSLGITLRGERAPRNSVLDLPAGAIELGAGRMLRHPALRIDPDARIGFVGPNGTGKSTLIRHILDRLAVPHERVVYMPQEIERAEAARVLAAVRALPDAQLGDVMTVVSCLGSDARRVLETDEPSPGEVRKILLALGMTRQPWLVLMDEPTNHLDLPSIECLEAAMQECRAALLLVSHDLRFLGALTLMRWRLDEDAAGGNTSLAIEHAGDAVC
jgi:ATPase subunit of ABC transporter with duplicated ATPase domains